MATDQQINSFIEDLPPQTSYLDNGFNKALSKTIYSEEGQSTADFGSLFEGVNFDKVIGRGSTTDSKGRIKIDFDKGQIVINDGSVDRVLIGELETET